MEKRHLPYGLKKQIKNTQSDQNTDYSDNETQTDSSYQNNNTREENNNNIQWEDISEIIIFKRK